jgi:hypothetical protein
LSEDGRLISHAGMLEFVSRVLRVLRRSADDAQYVDDEVEKALHEAFDMAEVAMQALERAQIRTKTDPPDAPRVENPWDQVPPRPRELQDLIRNLFAHDDIINESQQLPDVPAQIDMPYKQTLKKVKLSSAYRMQLHSGSIYRSLTLVTGTFQGILRDVKDPGKKDGKVFWTDAVSIQISCYYLSNIHTTDHLLRWVAIRVEKGILGF